MNKHLIRTLSLGLFAVAGAFAAETESPRLNHCVSRVYDPAMYNWLAFENNCGESIHIVYVQNSPGYGGSAMTVRPGRKGNTGYSRREVDAKGGYELYVCPAGFIPVDARGRYVDRVNTLFRCRRTD